MTILNPYISFRGDARAAMEFYQQALGGDLQVMTFGDMPGMVQDEAEQALVMHSMLTTPGGLVLMASDTPAHFEYKAPQGVSVSLSGTDEAEIRAAWDKLADGATVTQEFGPAPWGDQFGMLTDRFGVDWMFSAGQSQA
ncbi:MULTISPECIES: VOC family protein [unclassified Microbacterium]|uniref:VOC family protein n=1 Tax=unclassified Microbacterium TaxID=2609290 RepID=UPI001AD3A4C0|nr:MULTISPECIES: VOC family protein [unclassified Microbacterium]MBN9158048.1 VOC family protein [Microbacterium sp.]MBS1901440.1 VOC family protein [Actinomycetota bacterium]